MFEPVRQQWAGRPLATGNSPSFFRSAEMPSVLAASVDERADDYARGHADGFAAAEAALSSQRVAFDRLADAIASTVRMPPGSIEALLGEAAARIADALGVVDVHRSGPVVARLAEEIVGECVAVAIHVHPDQRNTLGDGDFGAPLIADPSVPVGAVRVRTAGGWIEDGVPVRLARFKAALDRGGSA